MPIITSRRGAAKLLRPTCGELLQNHHGLSVTQRSQRIFVSLHHPSCPVILVIARCCHDRTWHPYGIDVCLNARSDIDFRRRVNDFPRWHTDGAIRSLSGGSASINFRSLSLEL